MFGGFADILPTGCTLLAESAIAVADVDKDDIARRIQDAREDLDDAKDDDQSLQGRATHRSAFDAAGRSLTSSLP